MDVVVRATQDAKAEEQVSRLSNFLSKLRSR